MRRREMSVLFCAICIALCGLTALADEIRGTIQSVDRAARAVVISGVTILARDAIAVDGDETLIDFASLSPGDFLEADGDFTDTAELTAIKLGKYPRERDAVKGRIEKADHGKRLLFISGIKVIVADGARLEGYSDSKGSITQFKRDIYVECRGAWTGDRELTATKVEMN